jgi:hypothetical protein
MPAGTAWGSGRPPRRAVAATAAGRLRSRGRRHSPGILCRDAGGPARRAAGGRSPSPAGSPSSTCHCRSHQESSSSRTAQLVREHQAIIACTVSNVVENRSARKAPQQTKTRSICCRCLPPAGIFPMSLMTQWQSLERGTDKQKESQDKAPDSTPKEQDKAPDSSRSPPPRWTVRECVCEQRRGISEKNRLLEFGKKN